MAEYEDMMGQMGGLDPLASPVPGESLTADPETPAAFEQAPQQTDLNSAMEDLFFRITEPGTKEELLDLMRAETPVEQIAQVILFGGFREGQFTPDLMLTMIEPTIFVLLWLADYAGVEAVLYPEDDMGMDFEGPDFNIEEAPAPEGISEDLLGKIKAKKGES